jgi:acyl-CoA synthetase (AMP-forming)/AMP-acid ligase II
MTAQAQDFTLVDMLRRNADVHGDRVAFRQDGHTITHSAHWQRVQCLAAGLQQLGLAPGERVAILSKNRTEFMELLGATALCGAIMSAINWRLSAIEVQAVLAHDAPTLLVLEDELASLLDALSEASQQSRPKLLTVGDRRTGTGSLEDFYLADVPPVMVPMASATPLLLVHTAWTEGAPKAAVLSHANVLANAAQLQTAWALGVNDVHLCCLPLFHSTAISLTLAVQLAGGDSVLTRQFDPVEVVELTERHQVTVFGEFAPMLDGILTASAHEPSQLDSLRHVCGLDTPATILRFEATCPRATFWAGYGQSEVSGLATLGRFRDAPGAAGFPMSLCTLGIEAADGSLSPVGTTGEIVVRGPAVCLGYWQRPDATAQLLRGGWLHTGDTGRLDEHGRLWYTGRLAIKQLIKTGGENVYPSEVEAVIAQHPDIAEVVVFGVPDAQWGESIKAVCVSRRTSTPLPEEIIDFVASRIARYKRPRFVVFVPALVKLPDGSPDRVQLAKLHA